MADAVIFLAAGSGRRMHGQIEDKMLEPLCGRPVIEHSFEAFVGTNAEWIVVYRDLGQRADFDQILNSNPTLPSASDITWVQGGLERADSVFAGLEATSDSSELVFIHDCARPMIRPSLIAELALTAREVGAAVCAHRVTDTIKRVEAVETNGDINSGNLEDLDRSRLWAMETPQVFRRSIILNAYQQARESGAILTDDTAAVGRLGQRVAIVENRFPNIKLTHLTDFVIVTALLEAEGDSLQ